MAREDGAYLLLQRFLPEVAGGELRTLVAGGELIGSYARLPQCGSNSGTTVPLANLAAEADAAPGELSAPARELVQTLARELADLGAGFASVDTVDSGDRASSEVRSFLMEVNVANPGGLGTLAAFGDAAAARRAASAVARWRGLR